MLSTIVSTARFLWVATQGNRIRPWRSAYLRWRVETYSGKPAATLRLRDFLTLVLADRRQFARFLRWTGEIRQLAKPGTRQAEE